MTRIATTHVGSLPRRQRAVDFIFARERGESFDAGDFASCMAEECTETVRRQVEAGIDIVSDGETSKISYVTYVKDRYTGFSGDSERNAPGDLKLFPRFPRAHRPGRRNSPVHTPVLHGTRDLQGQCGSLVRHHQPQGRDGGPRR